MSNDPASDQVATQPPDPRRNLFWMFVSFMGVSIPKQGQEKRAMILLMLGIVLLLLFVAVGVLTLFKFW